MYKELGKWRSGRATRAASMLREIEDSIDALPSECLLDLHDIFRDRAASVLAELAEAEMARRGLKAAD